MKNTHLSIPIIIFILLTILNTFRIDQELSNYNESRYYTYETELQTIKTNIKNVSDTIFDNIINTPEIINIFKDAHHSNDTDKALIRNNLYNILKKDMKSLQTMEFNNYIFIYLIMIVFYDFINPKNLETISQKLEKV